MTKVKITETEAIEAVKSKLQLTIHTYLFAFSKATIGYCDAEEEAGIIADQTIKQLLQV